MAKKIKKIAIMGPVGISIPPKKQGGIEWVVYHLARGLVKKGHKVLLFAPKNAKTPAQLVPVSKSPMAEYKIPKDVEVSRPLRLELSMLSNMQAEVLKRKDEIGVILNHTVNGGIFAHLENILKIPVYNILHLPVYNELAQVYKNYNSKLISISDAQRKAFPKLNYVKTIYNGLDFKKIPFSPTPANKKSHFIFAGKLRPSKNPLGAILAVKKTNSKLILAGKISDQQYFEKKIKKHLSDKINYIGEISFQKLLKLYSQSKAFLFPLQWEEPFGLVMIEAMATGIPVIAFNRGSVKEIVEQGKTGFIVNNINQMAKAMEKIDKIDNKYCRSYVEKNFSIERMVNEYEKICLKHL